MRNRRRAGSKRGPYFTYNNTYTDTANGTSYSFASSNLGVARPDRLVVVVINAGSVNSGDITSCTIGGVSATLLNTGAEFSDSRMAYAVVPTGATGTIAVVFAASQECCAVSVFSLYNLLSTTPEASGENDATTSTTFNLSASKESITVYGVCNTDETAAISFTGSVPSSYEGAVDVSRMAAGAKLFATAQTVTCSATGGTGGSQDSFGASWK